jgi:YggT family protein
VFGAGCVEDATAGAEIVCLVFNFLVIAIFVRAILSWFQLDPMNPFIQALRAITDPIIEPIRNVMPRIGMFDLSPFVASILLIFISQVLQQFLVDSNI